MTVPNAGYAPWIIEGGDGIRISQTGVRIVISTTGGSGGTFIAPGPNFDTRITQLVLSGQRSFQLGEGDYEADAPIFLGMNPALISELRISGLGWRRTRILGTFPGSIVTADVPTNTLFAFQGQSTGAVNTTLSATAMSDTNVIVVASAAGIVAGMILRIVGGAAVPGVSDALDMSDSVAVAERRTELVEVDASYVGGTTVRLRSPMHQWHGIGASVESWNPVQNVVLEGMTLDCSGLAVAAGFMFEGAQNLAIADCAFTGFSRAGLDFEPGVRIFELDSLRSLGELNALWFAESAISGTLHSVDCKEDGLRVHATGEPRGLLTFWGRCTSIRCSDLTLQRGCVAVRRWGGWHLQFENTNVRDMNPDPIYDRSSLYATPAARLGMAYDGGTGVTFPTVPNVWGGFSAYGSEFAYSVEAGDWNISGCYADISHDEGAYSIYEHDVFHSAWGNVKVVNHGPGTGTVVDGRTVCMNGVIGADCFAVTWDKLDISGCTRGLTCAATTDIQVAEYLYDGAAGNAAVAIALLLDGGSGPKIRRMVMTGGGGIFFGPDWVFDPRFEIERFEWAGAGVWENVKQAVNLTGAPFPSPGVPVEFVATGVRDVGIAGAASDRACAAVAPVGGGAGQPCLVAPWPSVEAWGLVNGAGAAGDLLETNGAGQIVVNPASTAPVGRLKVNKAAGIAVVEIGAP